jgi:hypothetical protein
MTGCTALAPAGPLVNPLSGGSPALQTHEQTSVSLAADNFVLVKTNVTGQSKGFSLLGFITICPATLSKAMDRMYASAQLRPGEPQTVAHLIVEKSTSYWILFGIPKLEVHADVVAFKPTATTNEKARPQEGAR